VVAFTTLYIKVVQCRGVWVVHVWYCNKKFFTAAFKDFLNSTKDVDIGSEWLNYAMKFMVETKNCDTRYGSDVRKVRSKKWYVTHMASFLILEILRKRQLNGSSLLQSV
jgi:hypothetical protein